MIIAWNTSVASQGKKINDYNLQSTQKNITDGVYGFKCSPLQFFTSGGGSKAWKGDFRYSEGDEMKFYYDGQGFMSVELTPTDAKIVFHDVFGKVLHSLDLSKQLYTAM